PAWPHARARAWLCVTKPGAAASIRSPRPTRTAAKQAVHTARSPPDGTNSTRYEHAERQSAGYPADRRTGRRLRGYRHEPAVHHEGRALAHGPARRRTQPGHAVDPVLAAQPGGFVEMRDLHPARRQPRRRRDAGPDGTRPARAVGPGPLA